MENICRLCPTYLRVPSLAAGRFGVEHRWVGRDAHGDFAEAAATAQTSLPDPTHSQGAEGWAAPAPWSTQRGRMRPPRPLPNLLMEGGQAASARGHARPCPFLQTAFKLSNFKDKEAATSFVKICGPGRLQRVFKLTRQQH